MSHHAAGSLRHALKQVALTGATGSLLLGGAVAALAAPGAAAAPAVSARPVTVHAVQAAAVKRKVDVNREMRVAVSLKGRPYRYGAAGPWAFDCSGYTQYVFKKIGWRLNRTAASQYRQTHHVAKKHARIGDLVFFYGSGGIYHVGIYAGHGTMWAAPHTGAVVRHEKIYGSHWLVGRVV